MEDPIINWSHFWEASAQRADTAFGKRPFRARYEGPWKAIKRALQMVLEKLTSGISL